MPGVLGQVGQNVADNLYEIGQSAVKGTVGVVTDIAHESIEQLTGAPAAAAAQTADKKTGGEVNEKREQKRAVEKQRFDQVKAELSLYIQRKRQLDQKINEERQAENQQTKQEDLVEKRKRDSWVSKMINRSQTSTEKGRMSE